MVVIIILAAIVIALCLLIVYEFHTAIDVPEDKDILDL
jgi:hypothetical protein